MVVWCRRRRSLETTTNSMKAIVVVVMLIMVLWPFLFEGAQGKDIDRRSMPTTISACRRR